MRWQVSGDQLRESEQRNAHLELTVKQLTASAAAPEQGQTSRDRESELEAFHQGKCEELRAVELELQVAGALWLDGWCVAVWVLTN